MLQIYIPKCSMVTIQIFLFKYKCCIIRFVSRMYYYNCCGFHEKNKMRLYISYVLYYYACPKLLRALKPQVLILLKYTFFHFHLHSIRLLTENYEISSVKICDDLKLKYRLLTCVGGKNSEVSYNCATYINCDEYTS